MEDLQVLVEDLYRFRDHFFENHSISRAHEKPAMVQDKLSEVLEAMDKLNLDKDSNNSRGQSGDKEEKAAETAASIAERPELDDKAKVLYFKGRALNVTTEHNAESERVLSKAVKLEPSFVEAWNELGESYWKRNQVSNAQNCFEGALTHRENKISLRNLSIVMRQKQTGSHEERVRNIERGLSKAREAVQLDTGDGISWSILGNAYLAHFFSVSQNPRTLKQAMSAYKQAEKDVVAKSSPELHYNKGIALKFEEEYKSALDCFAQSRALDPTWESATAQEAALLKHLTSIQHLLENKGKLKSKKFHNLVESINPEKGLGHLSPQARSASGAKVYQHVELDQLVSESEEATTTTATEDSSANNTTGSANAAGKSNEGKVILGKVICSVHSEESVPFTFCLTDQNSRCIAVNLYNLAPGKGVIIGDSVAIAEPTFKRIDLTHNGQAVKFDLIRVESPLVLVINGKKANSDFQAGIQLSTFTKSD